MNLYILTTVVIGVFFLSLLYKITHIYCKNRYWDRAILSFLLVLLFKNDWGIHFYGLEYEDAYVFNFIARQFAHNIFSHSFLTDGILAGSIENPIIMGTYGGHFITYSTFVSYIYRFLGFAPQYICYANVFIEFLSLIILSIIPLKINQTKFWFLLPTIYCIAPIMNVFSTTGFSETFSSFICLSFLLSVFLYNKNKTWFNCFFSAFCLLMAFLCKRENSCLLIVPYLYVFFNYLINKKREKRDYCFVLVSTMTFVIYLTCIQNIFNIEQIEANDIAASTFSLGHFIQLFPIFVKALFSINYFSISVYILIISIFFIWKDLDIWSLIFIVLFGVYLFLYSFHYRGYFFVKYDDVSVFDTFRYINNFYYLLPLIVSPVLCKLQLIFNKKMILFLPCIVILSFSLITTINLRKKFSNIETENRFHTANAVYEYLKTENNAVLITENILLYQMISKNDFIACDINLIDELDNILLIKLIIF